MMQTQNPSKAGGGGWNTAAHPKMCRLEGVCCLCDGGVLSPCTPFEVTIVRLTPPPRTKAREAPPAGGDAWGAQGHSQQTAAWRASKSAQGRPRTATSPRRRVSTLSSGSVLGSACPPVPIDTTFWPLPYSNSAFRTHRHPKQSTKHMVRLPRVAPIVAARSLQRAIATEVHKTKCRCERPRALHQTPTIHPPAHEDAANSKGKKGTRVTLHPIIFRR